MKAAHLAAHYQLGLRDAEVLAQIHAHYPAGPTLHQLAPLDQLHIGGVSASKRLLGLLDPATHPCVLDIGAGLGGLMRQGAALGFQMTGLDITHRFSALNKALSALAAPTGSPLYWLTGDACAMPFADNSFDALLFQHSLLNMPNAHRVLNESRRVLRPGGKLAMHEVVSGPNPGTLRYPVPWAATPEHSHLNGHSVLKVLLEESGFTLEHDVNWSDIALEWRERQRGKEQTTQAPILSPQWVFGDRFQEMGRNLLLNLKSGAINLVEIRACC
ncbi:class I SAM-dependent methyltransferase [Vreelandella nanhaiensis]|uniref:Class I SAM-dependent methyltransferase n=1 Tax=Vreelandella nanhaiensis TaxID=1258546 RepID=A0A433KPW3_9GAMM|nr:class I SAM-dependent methyltransferase [Halomonas nanhaiensis]RUR31637.1 class I SAM-dependent methyltransferase [Halomonas nanhaiensis]